MFYLISPVAKSPAWSVEGQFLYNLESNLGLHKFAQIVQSHFSEAIDHVILQLDGNSKPPGLKKPKYQKILQSRYFKTTLRVKKISIKKSVFI